MTSKSKFRPSPAIVISCVALFLALVGTAFAAPKLGIRSAQIVDATIRTVDLRDNSVSSRKIADATVTTADLGADSVGTEEIAKDAVKADEIAENAVASPEVAPDSLTAGDLGPASVASSEVADQSLTQDDLGPNSVGSSELQTGSVRASELGAIIQVSNDTTIKGGTNASVSAACPAGTVVIGGGARAGLYQVHLTSSYRSGNGWHVDARSAAAGDTTLTAYAYCLTGGSSN
ncbi:MAG TPA: hypothetical protein VF729_04810 [Solirubrobacterales bacterium]